MKQNVDLIKFNLTPQMTKELIKFNDLKKELTKLKEKRLLTDVEVSKINYLENLLRESRKNFIKSFRENNKEEISQYLKLKESII